MKQHEQTIKKEKENINTQNNHTVTKRNTRLKRTNKQTKHIPKSQRTKNNNKASPPEQCK